MGVVADMGKDGQTMLGRVVRKVEPFRGGSKNKNKESKRQLVVRQAELATRLRIKPRTLSRMVYTDPDKVITRIVYTCTHTHTRTQKRKPAQGDHILTVDQEELVHNYIIFICSTDNSKYSRLQRLTGEGDTEYDQRLERFGSIPALHQTFLDDHPEWSISLTKWWACRPWNTVKGKTQRIADPKFIPLMQLVGEYRRLSPLFHEAHIASLGGVTARGEHTCRKCCSTLWGKLRDPAHGGHCTALLKSMTCQDTFAYGPSSRPDCAAFPVHVHRGKFSCEECGPLKLRAEQCVSEGTSDTKFEYQHWRLKGEWRKEVLGASQETMLGDTRTILVTGFATPQVFMEELLQAISAALTHMWAWLWTAETKRRLYVGASPTDIVSVEDFVTGHPYKGTFQGDHYAGDHVKLHVQVPLLLTLLKRLQPYPTSPLTTLVGHCQFSLGQRW